MEMTNIMAVRRPLMLLVLERRMGFKQIACTNVCLKYTNIPHAVQFNSIYLIRLSKRLQLYKLSSSLIHHNKASIISIISVNTTFPPSIAINSKQTTAPGKTTRIQDYLGSTYHKHGVSGGTRDYDVTYPGPIGLESRRTVNIGN